MTADGWAICTVLLALGTSVWAFATTMQARRSIRESTATINAAGDRLAEFAAHDFEHLTKDATALLQQGGTFYVIDLNYHDLLDPDAEEPEAPFDMFAAGPFDSYEEAQDYGNRNLQFFGVTVLT